MKNYFVLGVNEYLERLEGKIRKCLFFYVKILWNNSVVNIPLSRLYHTQDILPYKSEEWKKKYAYSNHQSFFFFFQLESLVQDMQDKVHGVPVRHQKVFLTSIPFAFMGKFFGQQQKKWCIYTVYLQHCRRNGSNLFQITADAHPGVSGVSKHQKLWGIQKYLLQGRPSCQNWVKSKQH